MVIGNAKLAECDNRWMKGCSKEAEYKRVLLSSCCITCVDYEVQDDTDYALVIAAGSGDQWQRGRRSEACYTSSRSRRGVAKGGACNLYIDVQMTGKHAGAARC